MPEITDAEVAEIQWASSEQGKVAVRAAYEKARRLGVDMDLAEAGAIVYAAHQAAEATHQGRPVTPVTTP